jgi:predicted SAM-dependent methyltransferase
MAGLRTLKSLARRGIEATRAAAAWAQWRVRRPAYPPGSVLRLHLGCGDIDHPGFVNVDGRPAPHVHHVQGLDRLDVFADASAELVYASHCLEHLPLGRVRGVLREWHRVLRPGGVLRLSVPDFDLLVDAYLDTGRNVRSVQMPLMGEQNYPLNFHYVVFTERFLSDLLVDAGFQPPRRWQPGEDAWANLPDWSARSMVFEGRTYPVSLNLQATK